MGGVGADATGLSGRNGVFRQPKTGYQMLCQNFQWYEKIV
jgi:hypothetical protein